MHVLINFRIVTNWLNHQCYGKPLVNKPLIRPEYIRGGVRLGGLVEIHSPASSSRDLVNGPIAESKGHFEGNIAGLENTTIYPSPR